MHTLASPPVLTYKLGKHTAATRQMCYRVKISVQKNDHTLLQVW